MSYGNMLSAFPELMTTISAFQMEKTDFKWGERYNKVSFTGYIQHSGYGSMGDHEGVIEDEDAAKLYVKGASPVDIGFFVEDGEDLWRIVAHDGFQSEGLFSEYKMRKVVSLTDEQTKDEEVDDWVSRGFKR